MYGVNERRPLTIVDDFGHHGRRGVSIGGCVDWLSENPWLIWLVITLALTGIEIVSLDLVFGMLAVGALAGLLSSFTPVSPVIQGVIAAIVGLLMLFLVRPVAIRHLRKGPPGQRTNVDALLGASALALKEVDSSNGLVKIGGDVWTARTMDADTVIQEGENVSVALIEGATAVVTREEVV